MLILASFKPPKTGSGQPRHSSEWMRNGDYIPSRWEAQTDAVNMLFDAKTNSNPEDVVGLMTMAGRSPEVLVTLTQDVGKILTALHSSKIAGTSNLGTGINIAQLALKHRQNKNQRQRIIAFVGSPLENESDSDLIKLGKKLKKNNVAVDIINFGEDETNEDKLETKVPDRRRATLSLLAAGEGKYINQITKVVRIDEAQMSEQEAATATGTQCNLWRTKEPPSTRYHRLQCVPVGFTLQDPERTSEGGKWLLQ
ncbi:unnamed protein product [Tilletia controversa]|nr:unnamed protein product [Tilletia controversa]